jgi:hypothetical protein
MSYGYQDHNRRDLNVQAKLSDQARDDAQRRTKRLRVLVEEWRTCICPLKEHKPACLTRRDCAGDLEKALDGDLL